MPVPAPPLLTRGETTVARAAATSQETLTGIEAAHAASRIVALATILTPREAATSRSLAQETEEAAPTATDPLGATTMITGGLRVVPMAQEAIALNMEIETRKVASEDLPTRTEGATSRDLAARTAEAAPLGVTIDTGAASKREAAAEKDRLRLTTETTITTPAAGSTAVEITLEETTTGMRAASTVAAASSTEAATSTLAVALEVASEAATEEVSAEASEVAVAAETRTTMSPIDTLSTKMRPREPLRPLPFNSPTTNSPEVLQWAAMEADTCPLSPTPTSRHIRPNMVASPLNPMTTLLTINNKRHQTLQTTI